MTWAGAFSRNTYERPPRVISSLAAAGISCGTLYCCASLATALALAEV